jgi:hypothetical protein
MLDSRVRITSYKLPIANQQLLLTTDTMSGDS